MLLERCTEYLCFLILVAGSELGFCSQSLAMWKTEIQAWVCIRSDGNTYCFELEKTLFSLLYIHYSILNTDSPTIQLRKCSLRSFHAASPKTPKCYTRNRPTWGFLLCSGISWSFVLPAHSVKPCLPNYRRQISRVLIYGLCVVSEKYCNKYGAVVAAAVSELGRQMLFD
jgi:hypothetical protein